MIQIRKLQYQYRNVHHVLQYHTCIHQTYSFTCSLQGGSWDIFAAKAWGGGQGGLEEKDDHRGSTGRMRVRRCSAGDSAGSGDGMRAARSGLIVQGDLTQADGHAERRAALDMIHRHSPGSTRKLTLGADKGFDAAEFVANLRQACVTPHVAQKSRYSAIDGRTTRHEGYALSIKNPKRIEEAFGWVKTVGGLAQTVHRGVERVRSRFILTMAANNLARLPRLLSA